MSDAPTFFSYCPICDRMKSGTTQRMADDKIALHLEENHPEYANWPDHN